MSLSKFMKRARASTKSLLGDSYEENVIDNPTVPEPPRDISAYSEERLKVGLRFADHSLRNKKRKVSPIAHHCLTLYKATLKAVLEKEYDDNDEKKELLSSLLLFERDIYTRGFLRRPVDTGDLNLVERLSQLRRFEFAARYGDYLARVCDQLKVTARTEETKYFEQLNGWDRYWTDINSDINKEHTSWRKWQVRDPAVTDADVKTTLAAFDACNVMGLNFDCVLQTIAMYADRNSLVHGSIQRLVEQGKWHVLRDTLARDLTDIPVVTPSHLRGNIPLLQETVQAVIDTYFDRRDGHRHDPAFWTPKEEAYDRAAKLAKDKEKKLETVLAERKLVEKLAAERCAKLIAESSMVHLAAAAFGTDAPSGDLPEGTSSKRPLAEADKTEKLETLKRRKTAWNKLVRLQRECHKNLKCYKDEYGNIEALIDPKVWLELSREDSSLPGSSKGSEA